jgi:hypothetical protein
MGQKMERVFSLEISRTRALYFNADGKGGFAPRKKPFDALLKS